MHLAGNMINHLMKHNPNKYAGTVASNAEERYKKKQQPILAIYNTTHTQGRKCEWIIEILNSFPHSLGDAPCDLLTVTGLSQSSIFEYVNAEPNTFC